ncbi:MerR family transcriptional regulator [Nocardia miyunensis]|uniref:MerR family transcriptional regulator n=1 Tax=Nocardia miyunensis TaxID=282684 RepID=UPI000833F958|nr:MerR family transcriptional regulator [Nocardia miyunensis]
MLIGEVSRRSGVSTRMLRHYDALGLVTPTGRTVGGYREYSAQDIRRLFHVECLRTLGLSLNEAKRAMDDPDFAPAALVGELIEHTRARIAAEQELLRNLERIDAAAPAQWGEVTNIVALLRGLESESGNRRQQAVLSQNTAAALPVAAVAQAALSEEDPNVAGALRWSLARAAGAGLAELAVGLDATQVQVRRRAVLAIAAVPTAEATTLLRRALDDADTTVRERAALALGSRQVAESIPVLLEMIVAGRSDVEAAEVLGSLARADDIVRAMRDELDGTADPATRLRITQAFAEIPGAAARAALTDLTEDHDRTVAATAAAIVGARDRRRRGKG